MSCEMVRLGDVAEVMGGYAFKSDDYKASGIPIVRISNINNEIVSFKEDCICVQETNNKIIEKFQVKAGDILVALSGATTGKYGVYKLDDVALLNQRVGLIRAKGKLYQQYLFYYLNVLQKDIERIAQGAAQPNISTNEIANLQIPLPPLPIQKRIAEILDAADALKRKDQELLKKYDELAQAIFIDMFGDPVKNEKGWEVKKLGDLFITNPRLGTIKPVSENGDIPVVRVGELGSLSIALEKCKKVNLNSVEKERFLLKKNDILLARAIGSIDHLGKASLIQDVSEDLVFDSHVMRLQFDQNVLSSYFFYNWLKSKGGRKIFLENSGKTAVQFNINGTQISRIKIAIPPITVQNLYLELSTNFQNQISILKKQNCESENLFEILVQKAFNGELAV